jgi:hypothetical protein
MSVSSQNPALTNASSDPVPLSVSSTELLAVWRETLGAPDAGIDENFFDAGGTSLLAARLAARIKAQLGCMLSAADILSHPSVRQLAKKLSGSEPALDRGASDRRAAMQRKAFTATRPTR